MDSEIYMLRNGQITSAEKNGLFLHVYMGEVAIGLGWGNLLLTICPFLNLYIYHGIIIDSFILLPFNVITWLSHWSFQWKYWQYTNSSFCTFCISAWYLYLWSMSWIGEVLCCPSKMKALWNRATMVHTQACRDWQIHLNYWQIHLSYYRLWAQSWSSLSGWEVIDDFKALQVNN